MILKKKKKITQKPFFNVCELLARFATAPNGKLNAVLFFASWNLRLYVSKKIGVSEYQDEKINLILTGQILYSSEAPIYLIVFPTESLKIGNITNSYLLLQFGP